MSFNEYGFYLNMTESPTIEDYILFLGTMTAFLAFILWCCFPLNQKEAKSQQFSNYNKKVPPASANTGSFQGPKTYYSIKNDSYSHYNSS